MTFSILAVVAITAFAPQAAEPMITVTTEELVPVRVTNPSWRSLPEVAPADYPILASHLGMSGRVDVECVVSAEGTPDCEATRAIPEGLGFEAAAIGIVERGRLNPRMVDGVPVEGKLKLGVPFVPEPVDPPPALWMGPSPTNANRLAGMVAAQTLGRSPNAASEIDWGLQQLSPDRALNVQGWIAEMYIGRTNAKLLAEGIAMVLAKRGETTVPAQNPADWDDWVRDMDQAIASIYSAETNFAPLRVRYCATYDCGSSYVVR